MAERKAMSKKLRFDVFKRDAFSCQYCGAHPPAAVLEVDHITPVAEGGQNNIDNLISACFSCNRGKGAVLLGVVPQSLKDKAAQIAEREEQLRGYQAILDAKRDRLEMEVEFVAGIYESFVAGYTISDSARVSARMFIDKLGVHSVMDAMEVACNRWPRNTNRIFKYFCGICWNRIREES